MTDRTRQKILEARSKFPKPQSAVLPALYAVQEEEGYVSESSLAEIAELLGVPHAEVGAVASFYTMIHRKPVGRYVLDVCRTISCELVGSRRIIDHISSVLGIAVGETTPDGLFTLREVECLGDCGNGPVMQIGDRYYEKLTPEKVDEIIGNLKAHAVEEGAVMRPASNSTSLSDQKNEGDCG